MGKKVKKTTTRKYSWTLCWSQRDRQFQFK